MRRLGLEIEQLLPKLYFAHLRPIAIGKISWGNGMSFPFPFNSTETQPGPNLARALEPVGSPSYLIFTVDTDLHSMQEFECWSNLFTANATLFLTSFNEKSTRYL